MKRLCFGLVREPGKRLARPCRQLVMKPLGLCARCRPAAPRKPSGGPTPEYQRARRARLAQAGVMPGWEVA